jgi:glycosyltransferase involved in cell wall biosynthesis
MSALPSDSTPSSAQYRPLVSAIIPACNAARFIGDALSSVRAQSYAPVECIVVDDGSTDDTAAIVERFGGGVRLERRANGGVASARNHGTRCAQGELLAFLDADDLWLPDKLERQVELFRRTPGLGLAYGAAYVVDQDLRPIGLLQAAAPADALRNTLLMELPIMPISMTGMVPARVFLELGGFDERLSTSADADFACRLAARYPVDAVREPVALYRQHDDQMHAQPTRMEHDMLRILQRFFGDDAPDASLRPYRRRAYANLYATLAIAFAARGAWGRSGANLARALARDPLSALRRLWPLLRSRAAATTPLRPAPGAPHA